tara:strand:- start:8716 stop:10173 length:1458 start_codon:yes stop_codon:yes gene_type:complete
LNTTDVLVVGSGMGALTSAALLANKGLKVRIIEQNWQPGGCTSSYWRKGYVFETGATTLVGLGEGMPLQYVIDKTGIELPLRKLGLPMQVWLNGGIRVNRYEALEEWITEAERVFGKSGQRAFWTECFKVSQFVWQNSLRQLSFPPTRFIDVLASLKHFSFSQLAHLPYAFLSVEAVLKKHSLLENKPFVDFVNEQLLITAQNHMEQVNFLFGAAALCYTNYSNYYVDGGLLNLVLPLVKYVEDHGGQIVYREKVESVSRTASGYRVQTNKEAYETEYLISGIPVNNTQKLFSRGSTALKTKATMVSEQLNGAFQMGIGFVPHRHFDSIHHQIHLSEPLPETGSASIFVSLNHPQDTDRTDVSGERVMSVSTHLPNPQHRLIDNSVVEKAIIKVLIKHDFFEPENLKVYHSSGPKSWQKWTGRQWGFVGGYPQYLNIKPWQMLDCRIDGYKAYQVGDTVYPGQGIPGVTLSGIIAMEKLRLDWKV